MKNAERVAVARERLSLLKDEATAARNRAPACSQCAYGTPLTFGDCRHPTFSRFFHLPQAGYVSNRCAKITAEEARSEEGLCGPDGVLFERRSRRQAIWALCYRQPVVPYVLTLAALVGILSLVITWLGRWS